MKTRLLLLISLSVSIGACTTEEEGPSPLWGIEYSEENASSFAMGSVNQYIDQTKTTYIVKTAQLRNVSSNVFTLLYTFDSGEAMELKVVKRTIDTNFWFPGNDGGNQLLSVMFKGELLSLDTDSKVSIQPRTEENKVATIATIHTLNKGLFDGAIGRVPLLK